MIPLATVLLSLFVVALLTRAAQLVAGAPLGETLQLGLLLVCAGFAAVEAHWAWTVRPRQPVILPPLRPGETLPRENMPVVTQEEPAP